MGIISFITQLKNIGKEFFENDQIIFKDKNY